MTIQTPAGAPRKIQRTLRSCGGLYVGILLERYVEEFHFCGFGFAWCGAGVCWVGCLCHAAWVLGGRDYGSFEVAASKIQGARASECSCTGSMWRPWRLTHTPRARLDVSSHERWGCVTWCSLHNLDMCAAQVTTIFLFLSRNHTVIMHSYWSAPDIFNLCENMRTSDFYHPGPTWPSFESYIWSTPWQC